MFIKPLVKYNKTTKRRYNIYQLCESFRLDGRVRHRIIIGFGKLDELPEEEQKKLLGKRVEELLTGQTTCLPLGAVSEKIEKIAHYYYQEIRKKQRYDLGKDEKDWQTVDLSTMKNNEACEVGAEWLCKQAFGQLDIIGFLRQKKWSEDNISLAATHIISRSVYPASEYKTVSFIKENSAICELTNYNKDKITKDKLYKISRDL